MLAHQPPYVLVKFNFIFLDNVGGIAQSVERWSNKPLVAGSIPSVTITLLLIVGDAEKVCNRIYPEILFNNTCIHLCRHLFRLNLRAKAKASLDPHKLSGCAMS